MAFPPVISVGPQSAVGTVSYNGFVFPAPVAITVDATPVYNSDGRTVKYNRYRITVQSPIVDETPGQSTDTVLGYLRTLLLPAGKTLVITGIGVGNLTVGTTTKDVAYGPKPLSLQWKPVGSDKACVIVWTVEVCIRDCSGGSSTSLIDLSYSITWAIDRRGLTVRTISGQGEIPIYLNADQPSNSADIYREQIVGHFERLPGFHREQNYNLSPDRKILAFSITDNQIPSDLPYPPKVADIRIAHNANSSGISMSKWINTLSGHIELMPGTPRIEAWRIFLEVLAQRRAASKLGNFTSQGREDGSVSYSSGSGVTILNRVDITEDLFGYGLSFAVSWTVTGRLEDFCKTSGLFAKYPDYQWQPWLDSIKSTLSGTPRGIAGLSHSAGEDNVILCDGGGLGGVTSGSAGNTNIVPDATATLSSEKPDPSNSWLYFDCRVQIDQDGNNAIHRVLRPDNSEHTNPINLTPTEQAAPRPGNTDTSENDFVQSRGSPKWTATIWGYAVRAGYPIPPFFITSIGGKKPTLRKRMYVPWQSNDAGGHPLFKAKWEYVYEIQGTINGDVQIETNGGLAVSNPTAFGG